MIIRWQQHDKDPKRLLIYLEGELWKEVSKFAFRRYLQPLARLSSRDEVIEKFKEVQKKVATNSAINALAKRARFTKSLRSEIAKKGIDLPIIDEVLEACTKKGYLNDAALACSHVRVRLRKGYGMTRILMELKEKTGLSLEKVKEMVEFDTETEEDTLLQLLEKKYKNRDLSDYKERQKVFAALVRRGYKSDQVANALSKKNLLHN